ncbi:hypothetical protein [Paenibacillus riograndensis]|nr:hypothetical protein [Paenibacillus riograndensis]
MADAAYIQWQPGNPLESAVVIEGWERTKDQPAVISWGMDGSHIDYWTDY